MMSAWMIASVGLVYIVVAVNLYMTGRVGLAIMFLGYAIGNFGLYLDTR